MGGLDLRGASTQIGIQTSAFSNGSSLNGTPLIGNP